MQMRFGEFTLDTETRLLLQNDTVKHVSPKAFELLRLLLEHRPRALSKADSTGACGPPLSSPTQPFPAWSPRYEPHSEKRRPVYVFVVRTVHRFGYAFNEPAD